MTINKSQGQSFEAIGINLQSLVFSHSQFYIAASRVTSKASLCILLPPNITCTYNIVYLKILQGLAYFYSLHLQVAVFAYGPFYGSLTARFPLPYL